jgi:2-oxoglutarate ferredoxin oxidoreductase subunit gamma
MNQPSFEKFQPALQDDGLQVVNSTLVNPDSASPRVRTVAVPANGIAEQLGNVKMANMVAFGAYLKASQILPLEDSIASLPQVISSHYQHLVVKNTEAIQAGYAAA